MKSSLPPPPKKSSATDNAGPNELGTPNIAFLCIRNHLWWRICLIYIQQLHYVIVWDNKKKIIFYTITWLYLIYRLLLVFGVITDCIHIRIYKHQEVKMMKYIKIVKVIKMIIQNRNTSKRLMTINNKWFYIIKRSFFQSIILNLDQSEKTLGFTIMFIFPPKTTF